MRLTVVQIQKKKRQEKYKAADNIKSLESDSNSEKNRNLMVLLQLFEIFWRFNDLVYSK